MSRDRDVPTIFGYALAEHECGVAVAKVMDAEPGSQSSRRSHANFSERFRLERRAEPCREDEIAIVVCRPGEQPCLGLSPASWRTMAVASGDNAIDRRDHRVSAWRKTMPWPAIRCAVCRVDRGTIEVDVGPSQPE